MMTRREMARAALAALVAPLALGCNKNGPKDVPATKLDRPIPPVGVPDEKGKAQPVQKPVKPEA